MPELDDWCVTMKDYSPYTPPECITISLHGLVSGHDRFTDGEYVLTSRIVSANKRKIGTQSGSVYTLGYINKRFRKWLKKERPDWDYRNPIKMKGGD